MDVYEFEKSFLDRIEEARTVLSWQKITSASQVRREWAAYMEVQVEPTGWQALWKIPRVICEVLHLRFPTVVFGYVDQVMFDDLKAVFVVTAVQDDDVHIPERNEVALVDLWATINQEYDALNVERTADCVDRLRFFYTHVWMPWDNELDNDRDWAEMHLETRVKLACDLNNRKVPRPLAAHIRTLLTEARYIQQRIDYLQLDLSDDEIEGNTSEIEHDEGKINESLSKLQVTDLMRLHLRLAIIRSEIEILENPEMRLAYDDLKEDYETRHLLQRKAVVEKEKHNKSCYVVMKPCFIERQIELLQLAKKQLNNKQIVQPYPSLQDVLAVCQSSDDILLTPGRHTIKFLEYLNSNGNIKGLTDNSQLYKIPLDPYDLSQVVVTSSDDDSILLVIDGDFYLEKLVLDCSRVRTGILLKSGKLHIKHCRLIGNNFSTTQQAIVCNEKAELILDHCNIEQFASGIILHGQVRAEFNDVQLKNCSIGIEILDKQTNINFEGENCEIRDCKVGVYVQDVALKERKKTVELESFKELQCYNMDNWRGCCSINGCSQNIQIQNKEMQLIKKKTLSHILEDSIISFADKETLNSNLI